MYSSMPRSQEIRKFTLTGTEGMQEYHYKVKITDSLIIIKDVLNSTGAHKMGIAIEHAVFKEIYHELP